MILSYAVAASMFVVAMGVAQTPSWAAEGDAGRDHYLRYCAACHGVEGNGNGIVSRSLKMKPVDLTQLKKKNKGVFPAEKVEVSIDGRTRIGAHGESKMPVWGEVFEKVAAGQKDPSGASSTKVKAIAEYLSTIQR